MKRCVVNVRKASCRTRHQRHAFVVVVDVCSRGRLVLSNKKTNNQTQTPTKTASHKHTRVRARRLCVSDTHKSFVETQAIVVVIVIVVVVVTLATGRRRARRRHCRSRRRCRRCRRTRRRRRSCCGRCSRTTLGVDIGTSSATKMRS